MLSDYCQSNNPMKPREPTSIDPVETLEQLRWLLNSFRMCGIRDLPTVKPESPPATPAQHPAPAPSPEEPGALLQAISRDLTDCVRCRLREGRNKLVFGEGSPRAPLVFVGEGPGFEEDQQGRPFVGRAGRLLDQMIRAMGFKRTEIYICNVVKCRPPKNRTPLPEEIDTCSPFLFRQLDVIQPAMICALGACAAQTLLGAGRTISSLRGKRHLWRGIPLVCTYHPAYLLRNPAQKAATWQDLLQVHRSLRLSERTSRSPS